MGLFYRQWCSDCFCANTVLFFLNKSFIEVSSHTIQFTHLSVQFNDFLINSQSCATITTINIFITPNRNPLLTGSHSPCPPVSSARGNHFLCQWIWLFWTFHINGSTQHVVFHSWLLSLGIMFSSFIYVVAMSIRFLFSGWRVLHCLDIPSFIDPLISWWRSELFPLFGYFE